MLKTSLITLLYLLFFFTSSTLYAQSAVEELSSDYGSESALPPLATENIRKISANKKVFIVTNVNKSFQKGDYITLVLKGKLVCRAVGAKDDDDLSGIKIIKIYSLKLWNQLAVDLDVQILRGDDTLYRLKKERVKTEKEEEESSKIESEEDLFNKTTVLEEDLSLDENSKRKIRTDNILAFGAGVIAGIDTARATTNYMTYFGQWAYQVADNIWVEALYGRSLIKDYPAAELETQLSNYTARIKYTIEAPLYIFIQPYAGYQFVTALSSGAGENTASDTVKQKELELVADQQKSQPIFGITLLKRLVPGWFVRADLGTDLMGGGLALEF